jgi:predicted MFS family arabinose efflux permease
VSTGLCHPATNHLIGLRVSEARRALAFGLKQSAVPIASLLAGLAIPVIALSLGWRWAYGIAAFLALVLLACFLALGPRRSPKGAVRRPTSAPLSRVQRSYFLLIACVTTLGAGAATTAATFGVVSAIERGIHPGTAGLLLGAASAVGAAMRIAVGALSDRRKGDTIRTIGIMQFSGAAGAVLMTIGPSWLFGMGLVLALGVGWGWTGLVHFVVSQTAGPATPSATAIVQTGSYLGCAAAPIIAGIIYATAGTTPIWIVCAAMFVVAGCIGLAVARRPVPLHEGTP